MIHSIDDAIDETVRWREVMAERALSDAERARLVRVLALLEMHWLG